MSIIEVSPLALQYAILFSWSAVTKIGADIDHAVSERFPTMHCGDHLHSADRTFAVTA